MAGLSVVPMESALSANTPAIGAHERAEVGNELQSVLLDLIDLSLLGKQLPSRGTIRGTRRTGLHLPAAGPGGNAAQSQSRLNSCQTGHPGHCQLPLHTREVATDASADGLDRQQATGRAKPLCRLGGVRFGRERKRQPGSCDVQPVAELRFTDQFGAIG